MWEVKSLTELEEVGVVNLGRGKIISKKDLAASPGDFPVYSSSKVGDGKFGDYGLYMFDEELITWSVDGGGRLFHREKHKFSITNVTGFLRILDASVLSYKYLYYALSLLHSKINFDWVKKAHPSVLRKEYKHIPVPPLAEQQRIVAKLDAAFAEIDSAIEAVEKCVENTEKLRQNIVDTTFNNVSESPVYFHEVAEVKHGFAFKSEYFSNNGEMVLLTPGNFNELGGYRDRGDKQKYYIGECPKEFALSGGELLVAMTEQAKGLLGSPIIVPNDNTYLHNQRLGKVVVGQNIHTMWLYYFFNSTKVREHLHRTGTGLKVRHTSPKKIGELSIKISRYDEQLSAVQKLNELHKQASYINGILHKKTRSLFSLKSAILTQELQSEAA